MSKIVLIRHGQSEYNVHLTKDLDSALTEQGIVQVEETARNLKKIVSQWGCEPYHITCWTSPYLRCLQTSEILQKMIGLNFRVDQVWLREIMTIYDKVEIPCRKKQFSQFEWGFGKLEKWPYWKETDQGYIERIEACKKQIERHPFFIGVSHGTPITDLISMFNGKFNEPNLHNYVDNASINLIET